jgi:hypothetical protein
LAITVSLKEGNHILNIIKVLCKRLANYFGAILISRVTYEKVLHQRKALFKLLLSSSKNSLLSGTACVIFSKDRPMQLYGLLDSYFRYVANPLPITVIYTYKDKNQKKAYLDVIKYFKKNKTKINFIDEMSSFKDVLFGVLSKIREDKILFLVDDIIFIKSVDFNIFKKINTKTHVLSLRHSPFLRKSFTTKTNHSPPSFNKWRFSDELLEFNWFESGGEWSDPWSIDGQLLNTSEVLLISNCSNFRAPNSYEIALKAFNDIVKSKKGLCFNESKILNLPINRVQNEVNNISGNISVDSLLDKWNQGYCIDTSIFKGHVPLSTHEEHTIKLIKRSNA